MNLSSRSLKKQRRRERKIEEQEGVFKGFVSFYVFRHYFLPSAENVQLKHTSEDICIRVTT